MDGCLATPPYHSNQPFFYITSNGYALSKCHSYQIPYRASVKNRSNRTYAATSDVVMMYEDMWTTSAMTSQQEVWLSSLAPSETKTVDFYLEVPTTASCTGPVGATDVWFIADWNETSVFDSNRNNNTVYFDVDSNYWKPDYVISSVTRGSNANRINEVGVGDVPSFYSTISYTIRNIGPSTASVPPWMSMSHSQVLDPDGVRVFSAVTGDIPPGGEVTYETSVNDHGCDPLTFVVEADYAHAIDEFAESNNTANITLSSIEYCAPNPRDEHDLPDEQDLEALDHFYQGEEQTGGHDSSTDWQSEFPILDDLGPGP